MLINDKSLLKRNVEQIGFQHSVFITMTVTCHLMVDMVMTMTMMTVTCHLIVDMVMTMTMTTVTCHLIVDMVMTMTTMTDGRHGDDYDSDICFVANL